MCLHVCVHFFTYFFVQFHTFQPCSCLELMWSLSVTLAGKACPLGGSCVGWTRKPARHCHRRAESAMVMEGNGVPLSVLWRRKGVPLSASLSAVKRVRWNGYRQRGPTSRKVNQTRGGESCHVAAYPYRVSTVSIGYQQWVSGTRSPTP